jgi:hypothetical protein
MKLPNLIPPEDLLKQIDGIEDNLQRGRQLGRLGMLGALASAVSVANLVLTSTWFDSLTRFHWDQLLQKDWPLIVTVIALAFFIILANWNQIWIRQSEEPFRYTYWVNAFKPVKPSPTERQVNWLQHDVSQQLSDRIKRLSLLEERRAGRNHVSIGGEYLIREEGARWRIEITPWVRIGPPGQPATLARAIVFDLTDEPTQPAKPVRKTRTRVAEAAAAAEDHANPEPTSKRPPELSRESYRLLLERVYFSVATQIYKQIRQDVQHKIDLLPTSYFRTAAYFHEAEDYARSNTLDAYDDARALYYEAIQLIDPARRELPDDRLRRWTLHAYSAWSNTGLWLRERAARLYPRMGQLHIMLARAEMGYANMLVYRRVLAGLSGNRVTAIFEARPVAENAVRRLECLPADTPLRRDILFDAYVTLALTWAYLGSHINAEQQLVKARGLSPSRADADARFLFASALTKPGLQIQQLQNAVEIDPGFEVAVFELALRHQMEWLRYRELEASTAALVCGEYDRILSLNPGNVAAYANAGFMLWLLSKADDPPDDSRRRDVKSYYERGRRYKEIKRETFVVEIDFGLARLAAEEGHFEKAYEYYESAVGAYTSQGVQHTLSNLSVTPWVSSSVFATPRIVERYAAYRRRVEDQLDALAAQAKSDASTTSRRRILDTVRAYVLYECGVVCFTYYTRSGDEESLDEATKALRAAVDLVPSSAVFWLYLGFAELYECARQFRETGKFNVELMERTLVAFDRAIEVAGDWSEARLAALQVRTIWANLARQEADNEDLQTEEARKNAEIARQRAAQERIALSGQSAGQLVASRNNDLDRPTNSQRRLAEARYLREASRHKLEAETHMHGANTWRIQEREAYQMATEFPRDLVPHQWVDSRRPAITSVRPGQVWQREFEERHVSALLTWCEVLVEAKQHGFFDDWPASKIPDASQWLDLIRANFWAHDLDVLQASRDSELLTWVKPAYNERLYQVIAWSLGADPGAYLVNANRATLLLRLDGDDQFKQRCRELALKALRGAMQAEVPSLLREVAQTLEALGECSASLETYQRGLQLDRAGTSHIFAQADYTLGIARMEWLLQRYAAALQALTETEAEDSRAPAGWRMTFVDTVIANGHLGGTDEYWTLRCWLEASLDRARRGGRDADRADCGTALLRMSSVPMPGQTSSSILRLSGDREQLAEAVTPIAIEVGDQLHELMTRDAATLEQLRLRLLLTRGRITKESGVTVPPPRVCWNPQLGLRDYAIRLHGVALAGGSVPSDAPDARLLILGELDRVVREQIESFIDLQEVRNMLDRYVHSASTDAAEQLCKEAVPDIVAHTRLTRVLRGLLEDGVRITNLEAILTAFRDTRQPHVSHAERLERMRGLLQPELPGNAPGRVLLGFAQEFEAAVGRFVIGQNGSRVLAMPTDTRQVLQAAIQAQLAHYPADNLVLVVTQADLRPFVHQLVDRGGKARTLPVVAASELTDWVWPREKIQLPQPADRAPAA